MLSVSKNLPHTIYHFGLLCTHSNVYVEKLGPPRRLIFTVQNDACAEFETRQGCFHVHLLKGDSDITTSLDPVEVQYTIYINVMKKPKPPVHN